MALDRIPSVSLQTLPIVVQQPLLGRTAPLINSLRRQVTVLVDKPNLSLALKVLACGVLLGAAILALRTFIFPKGKASIVEGEQKDLHPSLPNLPSGALVSHEPDAPAKAPEPTEIHASPPPTPAATIAPTISIAAAPVLNAAPPEPKTLAAAHQPQAAPIPAAALLQSTLPAPIDSEAIDRALSVLFLAQPPKKHLVLLERDPALFGSYVGMDKGLEYSDHDKKILAFLGNQNPPLHIPVEEVKERIEIGKILVNYAQDPSKTREVRYILAKLNDDTGEKGDIIRAFAQASLIWYFMDIAIAQWFNFKEGSFNVDDETGGLEKFMGEIKGAYFRICSHINRHDDSKTKGFNVDNLREGSMPGDFRHILIKGFVVRGKHRLFIKPEHWGTQGNGIINSIVHFVGHSYEYMTSLGARKITGSNARKDFHKERIPEEKRKKFIEVAKELPGFEDAIKEIGKDGAGTGVGGMYIFAKETLRKLTDAHPNYEALSDFVEYLEMEYPVESIMDRIGDEPVINSPTRSPSPTSPLQQE